jgi:hypothetical protein
MEALGFRAGDVLDALRRILFDEFGRDRPFEQSPQRVEIVVRLRRCFRSLLSPCDDLSLADFCERRQGAKDGWGPDQAKQPKCEGVLELPP